MSVQARRAAQIEDPGHALIDRMTGYVDRYGRMVLIALGLIVVAGAVVFFTLRSRRSAEEQAAGRLAQANVLYWQGNYAQSLDQAKQVAQQYPSTPSGIDAHRLAGDDAYWSGDFKTAVTEYRAYLDRSKTGIMADAVRRSLAYALESDHQYLEAAPIYESLIGKFDRESSAEFLSSSARCYREAGQPAAALERLRRLVKEYGSSSYAEMAQIEIAELGAAH